MRTEQARPVRLKDYRPPDWLVETVELDISLHPTKARVRAALRLTPNPQAQAPAPLVLEGDDVNLVSVAIDGQPVPPESYAATADSLTIPQPPHGPFTLTLESLVDPSANTQLMGLYRSGKTYCTQCEPEGFRRITYFPDRPDVMAVYTTRIEADKAEAPILLANGNLTASGDLPGGRHFAVWHDPFRKPSYLFALVGGDLACVEDNFVTMSGREVTLRIYRGARQGGSLRLRHGLAQALDALGRGGVRPRVRPRHLHDRRGLRLQHGGDGEQGPQRLQRQIRAGEPGNRDRRGLRPVSKAIIAHEYFHNWTGNRITCRDWFQLCLKEGLTVFRDQEFTSDQRSRPVKRISDVRLLRAHQFTEDAGPLAHPVRPEVYSEINNFYTATVYEKGAEVIRMLKVLLGAGGLPHRHGPLFRAARRRSVHDRAVHPVLRGCQQGRPDAVHALVRPGRHAGNRRDGNA